MGTWHQRARGGDSIACISAGGVELLLFGFSWSLYFQLESVFSFTIFHLVYFNVLVPHRLCGKTSVFVSLFNWLLIEIKEKTLLINEIIGFSL